MPTTMPSIISPYALASTYPRNGELEAWSRVQEYRRVQDYCADHPEEGSHAVSTALELPRSRIRPWIDGDAKPEPIRAIDTARDLGWLDVDVDTEGGHAWTRLIAWIYAGGSLAADTYQPRFYARTDQRKQFVKSEMDILASALSDVGASYRIIKRTEKAPEEMYGDERVNEIVVRENATLLGRCFAAAGAHVGAKTHEEPSGLPEWLFDASPETRAAWCRVYLLNRGTFREREPAWAMKEERADSYHEDVKRLFTALTHPEVVSRSGHTIFLHSRALDALLDY
ncbi:sister chromatid cohesion protein PDS5 [Halorubellus salinus]|uniref:sister chromatid cohesion protein PDS5 n=1 Tax=Halorubellus salinus TaxID=755309 RepID=UPI001D0767AA|nr:sister chromatid cohesion protein PDS5 [Halorubellus salinus]